jgi:hypothetical protein
MGTKEREERRSRQRKKERKATEVSYLVILFSTNTDMEAMSGQGDVAREQRTSTIANLIVVDRQLDHRAVKTQCSPNPLATKLGQIVVKELQSCQVLVSTLLLDVVCLWVWGVCACVCVCAGDCGGGGACAAMGGW